MCDPYQLRVQFEYHLSAIPMKSIIDWYSWNDPNGDFEDMTFCDCVDIAVDWFDSLEEVAHSRYSFLESTE